MTIKHQIELSTGTIFLLAVSLGVFLAIYHKDNLKITTYALPSAMSTDSTVITPAVSNKEEIFSQISPNGKKKVTISVKDDQDSNKKYTITTADGDNNHQIQIYSFIFPASENLAIPFNTFSPDNKYFFVIHKSTGLNEAIVFRTDGEKINDSDQYIEVAKTFAEKNIKNPYKQTTGWASETLLIVNSAPENGSKQSYWIEVPSKAIIGLSTEFYD